MICSFLFFLHRNTIGTAAFANGLSEQFQQQQQHQQQQQKQQLGGSGRNHNDGGSSSNAAFLKQLAGMLQTRDSGIDTSNDSTTAFDSLLGKNQRQQAFTTGMYN